MNRKKMTIAVGTIFQDAGEATRALEIAMGLRDSKPDEFELRVVFLSRGSRFEQRVIDAGFEIYHAAPQMSGIGFHQDLKTSSDSSELIGDEELALELLKGEIRAYSDIKPDVVLYGMWPIAGIARKMMGKEIPGICFLPLPLSEAFLKFIPDIPDNAKPLSLLPYKLRMMIFRMIPEFIKKRKVPILKQNNIRKAAMKLGWKSNGLLNILDLLKADLNPVTDLPDYYERVILPDSFVFTGPLFSSTHSGETVNSRIKEVFDPQNGKVKIYCTLGSSGRREQLLEIIKVFTAGEGLKWNAVILAPSSICPLEEAEAMLGERKGVFITNEFVPARAVNALADVVVCHGGQGTVQTALSSLTPLVGVGMQMEQVINLSHVALYGAGIRIHFDRWKSNNIRNALSRIIADRRFKEAAVKLGEKINAVNGREKIAKAIWSKIREL